LLLLCFFLLPDTFPLPQPSRREWCSDLAFTTKVQSFSLVLNWPEKLKK